MRQVYLTQSLQEAEFLRMLLRKHGISSTLENEFSSNVALVPVLISVSDEDEKAAIQVLRAYLAKSDLQP